MTSSRGIFTVILLGNYPGDQQQSMLKFSETLAADLEGLGVAVRLFLPPPVLGRFFSDTTNGAAKWGGYVDKFIIFPLILVVLRMRWSFRRGQVIFHVCDHSNAPWMRWLPKGRTVITCHDVLAIRGAQGHAEVHSPASATGKIFQRWILRNLLKARVVACVSNHTLKQLQTLEKESRHSREGASRVVIANGFNADFRPLSETRRVGILEALGLPRDARFLLHIGSSQARKNRRMLIDMLVAAPTHVRQQIDVVCFAGAPVDPVLRAVIDESVLGAHVIACPRPSHEQLVALYQSCAVFVFPSYAEGFGWPVIEAQSVGAAVLTSQVEPMPEVGGDGALYADPSDPLSFAVGLQKLLDPAVSANLRRKGERNRARFDNEALTRRYVDLYSTVLADGSR